MDASDGPRPEADDPLAAVARLAGSWQATYQLRGDPSFEGDSPSAATVAPLLGGRFIRIDYSWSDRGVPQAGLLLIGRGDGVGTAAMVWLDTWHNGHRMMVCHGTASPDGGIDVRGSYPAGPGERDWGWRTCLEPGEAGWTMRMFNVTPDGTESLAVAADYRH